MLKYPFMKITLTRALVVVGPAKPIFRFTQNERQTRREGFLRQTPDISPVVSDASKGHGDGCKKNFSTQIALKLQTNYISPSLSMKNRIRSLFDRGWDTNKSSRVGYEGQKVWKIRICEQSHMSKLINSHLKHDTLKM